MEDESLGQEEIAGDIRDRIVRGELAPGTRLPGHRKLVEQYDSSIVTVQRAMRLLIEEGFVESIARKGRYVVEYPPHSHRVGVVFPGHPEKVHRYHWTRYLAAVRASARKLNADTGWNLVPYFDVEPMRKGELTAGYRNLMEDIRADLLGGLIFAFPPLSLTDTELVQERPVPMVTLSEGWSDVGPAVGIDRDALIERAVKRLAENNRSRIAWAMIIKHDPEWLRPRLEQLEHQYEFSSPTRWIHPIDPFQPNWVRHTFRGVFDNPDSERPNGLVVMDDHLTEASLGALRDLGLTVGDDVHVVSHWNFPIKYEGEAPMDRIGLDTRGQLEVALEQLRSEIDGKQTDERILLRPISAAEFEERYSPENYVPFGQLDDERDEDASARADVDSAYATAFGF